MLKNSNGCICIKLLNSPTLFIIVMTKYNDTNTNEHLENYSYTQENRKKNTLLIVLIAMVGVLGLLGAGYLFLKKDNTSSQYEEYVQKNRDSVMLVLAQLNKKIDDLEISKIKLTGEVSAKNSVIVQLNNRITYLLRHTISSAKYHEALQRIKELENYILKLTEENAQLRAENEKLKNENKVYIDQVRECDRLYEDLKLTMGSEKMTGNQIVENNVASKEEDAQILLGTTADNPQPKSDAVPYGDDYSVQVQNLMIRFIASDKKGRIITKTNKISLKDIKAFSISFDGNATKEVEQLFYVRITDSIQANLVVSKNYAQETEQAGKKILKLPNGEEVPYSYAFSHLFKNANDTSGVSHLFYPLPSQIRYLPYRVEIYDGRSKLAEVYRRPPTNKR